jgi:hypothetical protein
MGTDKALAAHVGWGDALSSLMLQGWDSLWLHVGPVRGDYQGQERPGWQAESAADAKACMATFFVGSMQRDRCRPLHRLLQLWPRHAGKLSQSDKPSSLTNMTQASRAGSEVLAMAQACRHSAATQPAPTHHHRQGSGHGCPGMRLWAQGRHSPRKSGGSMLDMAVGRAKGGIPGAKKVAKAKKAK